MKKAIVILSYISFGIAIVTAITNLVLFIDSLVRTNTILVSSIVNIIFNIATIALVFPFVSKIQNAKTRDDLIVWGIVGVIFVNLIAGILTFCLKDSDINPTKVEAKVEVNNHVPTSEKINDDDPYNHLMRLKDLFENGYITEEEYKEKRQKYVDKI